MDDSTLHPDDNTAAREGLLSAIDVLESVAADRSVLASLSKEEHHRLMAAAGRVTYASRTDRKKLQRALASQAKTQAAEQDNALLNRTGIRKKRSRPNHARPQGTAPRQLESEGIGPVLSIPEVLNRTRRCYVCKTGYSTVHHFYDSMCEACGKTNLYYRNLSGDLSGRTALVTGGRVKIGFQVTLKLLRAGARVLVTTRFPVDAAKRFLEEHDSPHWEKRLSIFALDFRNIPSVEAFCEHVKSTEQRLDFIINNACQTVRRPAGYYLHLMEHERQPDVLPPQARDWLIQAHQTNNQLPSIRGSIPTSAEASQVALLAEDNDTSTGLFPVGALDADKQQIDLRERNSWRLQLEEVSSVEMLEVQLVNTTAPFIINGRLKSLMTRTPERDKHVVNVSAMEGQFYRKLKTSRHPHTNMAKAALNMMTRTAAADFIEDGIHMNSVDTGWITDEDPAQHADRKRDQLGFHPPLDVIDGAARILAPIFEGMRTGQHVWGCFLKDYQEADW